MWGKYSSKNIYLTISNGDHKSVFISLRAREREIKGKGKGRGDERDNEP